MILLRLQPRSSAIRIRKPCVSAMQRFEPRGLLFAVDGAVFLAATGNAGGGFQEFICVES